MENKITFKVKMEIKKKFTYVIILAVHVFDIPFAFAFFFVSIYTFHFFVVVDCVKAFIHLGILSKTKPRTRERKKNDKINSNNITHSIHMPNTFGISATLFYLFKSVISFSLDNHNVN